LSLEPKSYNFKGFFFVSFLCRTQVSVEEIQETLLHSLPYCGAPATQEAFRAALEVIQEYQAAQK